mmetsp:Transcript_11020/g.27802  ORF Transcript_11020/g.27802 Transcript_11020/m.27802 type:complete len:562 (+) Transcript_11020:67-1752(+)
MTGVDIPMAGDDPSPVSSPTPPADTAASPSTGGPAAGATTASPQDAASAAHGADGGGPRGRPGGRQGRGPRGHTPQAKGAKRMGRPQEKRAKTGDGSEPPPQRRYEERREPGEQDQPRPDALYVYGVDFLNTSQVRMVFGNTPAGIEWIDDSSCAVVFHDELSAMEALERCCPVKQEGSDVWRKTRPLHGIGKGVPNGIVLECRMANFGDVKAEDRPRAASKFWEWNQERQLKKQQRQERKLEKVLANNNVLSNLGVAGAMGFASAPRLGGEAPATQPAAPANGDLAKWMNAQEEQALGFASATTAAGAQATAPRASSQRAHSTDSVRSTGAASCDAKASAQTIPPVYRFIKDNKVKCKIVKVHSTVRELRMAVSRKLQAGGKTPTEAERCKASQEMWDAFLTKNSLSKFRLAHALYWKSGDKGLLMIVLQGTEVDKDAVAKLVPDPEMCSLAKLQRDTGFPQFVSPPFGHEFSAPFAVPASKGKKRPASDGNSESGEVPDTTRTEGVGKLPTYVDSAITASPLELVFPVGKSAITITPAELVRATQASVVEGLAKPTKVP